MATVSDYRLNSSCEIISSELLDIRNKAYSIREELKKSNGSESVSKSVTNLHVAELADDLVRLTKIMDSDLEALTKGCCSEESWTMRHGPD